MKTLDERVSDLVSGWIVSFTWSTWGNHHISFHCRPAKNNSCLSNCWKWHFQLKIHCAFSFLLSVIFCFVLIVSKRKITVWKIKQNIFFWNWSFLCLSERNDWLRNKRRCFQLSPIPWLNWMKQQLGFILVSILKKIKIQHFGFSTCLLCKPYSIINHIKDLLKKKKNTISLIISDFRDHWLNRIL